MQNNTQWQCRVSPTLGSLESSQNEVWVTKDYTSLEDPTVFMGIYGLPDFMALRQHKGRKAVFWCGTDILHLENGYWIDDMGKIKVDPKPFCEYLNTLENWVENKSEQDELKNLGIESKVCPSFVGDVSKFEISYKWSDKPKLYTSVSGDDFERYGWDKVPKLAEENPDIEFHCYGNTIPYFVLRFLPPNVILHGRVPKEQMNEEIKEMQGCLRLIEMEGFSEIVAKAMLMGQYPISTIEYPHTLKVKDIGKIFDKKEPNIKGREWVLKNVNNYPWNETSTTNN